jgi:hypothetical protein
VRRRGESEGPGDELGVGVHTLGGELGEQPLEELFVPLTCFEGRHFRSVLRGLGINLLGRNDR